MIITRLNEFDGADAIFKRVHNGNAADPLVPGDVVEYELAATADYPGVSVVDGTAADPLTAGVVVGKSLDGVENIAAGEFGYIQVSGLNKGPITTDTTIAAGDLLIGGAAVADAGLVGTNGEVAFGVALAADTGSSLPAGSAVLYGRI